MIGPMRALAILLLLIGACSGPPSTPDAGGEQATLEILDPPGDSIGLAFSSAEELRVRYLGTGGEPRDGTPISFELVAGPSEEVGGATLSSSASGTKSAGVAAVVLTAGTIGANFRVRVTAPGAPEAIFFVVVSEDGFAAIDVRGSHSGPRPVADYDVIEFRLYDPSTVRCTDIDIDAIPMSVFPPRSTSGFDTAISYRNLAPRAYTVLVWGESAQSDQRLGVGCVELDAMQTTGGPAQLLEIAVVDRPLTWSTPISIESTLVFANLSELISASVTPDPWIALACDAGPAQLLIDCMLDAAFDDGTLDCAVGASDSLIDDIEALRDVADPSGCRPLEVSPGVASLDSVMIDTLTVGPWTVSRAMASASSRAQLLTGFTIYSNLSMTSVGIAQHGLQRIRLAWAGLTHEVDLRASARPVIDASVIPTTIDGGRAFFTDHEFTLDLERALATAFETVQLPTVGLGDRTADLGSALAQSFGGCNAISQLLCSEAARPGNCLVQACADAADLLNGRLRAWIDASAATGLDFALSGNALITDRDFDLEVDSVGESEPGQWRTAVQTAAGEATGVGVFRAGP